MSGYDYDFKTQDEVFRLAGEVSEAQHRAWESDRKGQDAEARRWEQSLESACGAVRDAGISLEYVERQLWIGDALCHVFLELVYKSLDAMSEAKNEQAMQSASEAYDHAREQYEITASRTNSLIITARLMGSTMV